MPASSPTAQDVPASSSVIATRFLRDWPGNEHGGRTEVLMTPCDILIPAALERQIDADLAERLECRLVVEAANGPTTPQADVVLARRNIPVLPDVLANAGGVAVSYYEWVQDQQKITWGSKEIAQRLEHQLNAALDRVCEISEQPPPPTGRHAARRPQRGPQPPSANSGQRPGTPLSS